MTEDMINRVDRYSSPSSAAGIRKSFEQYSALPATQTLVPAEVFFAYNTRGPRMGVVNGEQERGKARRDSGAHYASIEESN